VSARDKVLEERDLVRTLQSHRRAGRRIVLTNGAFDVLHPGHVRALEEAATHGGVLVVAVNDDDSVRGHKGPDRPIVTARDRAEVVAALACVDYVVVFPDATVDRLLEALRPDVHAKGRDYTPETIPERETARRLGVETAIVGDAKTRSSTQILSRAGEWGTVIDRVAAVERHGARGWALADARPFLEEHGWLDLERLVITTEGAVVQRTDRGFVRRIEVGHRALYVKVVQPSDRRHSAVFELQNHLALRAAGFRAAEPWLGLEGRVGGRSASALVTLEAPGLALDEYLALHGPDARPRQRHGWARGIGSLLRALHAARFLIPDLCARQLFVDGSPAAGRRATTFVDVVHLERAGRRLKRKEALEGLASLALSLRETTTPRFRLAVLRAYLSGSLEDARAWIDDLRARTDRLAARVPARGAAVAEPPARDLAARPAARSRP
jgi:rfaE bifunctional protein nucleotidyltransferase chain/domain